MCWDLTQKDDHGGRQDGKDGEEEDLVGPHQLPDEAGLGAQI